MRICKKLKITKNINKKRKIDQHNHKIDKNNSYNHKSTLTTQKVYDIIKTENFYYSKNLCTSMINLY